MTFVPITYRDFFDVPRVFIAEWNGNSYVFDAPFDGTRDAYADSYVVFKVNGHIDLANMPDHWNDLRVDSQFCGEIAVSSVTFDATKRASIDDAILRSIDQSRS